MYQLKECKLKLKSKKLPLITLKCSVNQRSVNCEVVEIPSSDVIRKTRNDYIFCIVEDQTFVLIFLKFSSG